MFVGTVGVTTQEAFNGHPASDIHIFQSSFISLFNAFSSKPVTKVKLICLGNELTVIGLHCIGHACDELLQGFTVAMSMGATKGDFDQTISVHPTTAEEFVTLSG
eukprot:Platyproteum_vivax@DN3206_c0_g1_i1.p1